MSSGYSPFHRLLQEILLDSTNRIHSGQSHIVGCCPEPCSERIEKIASHPADLNAVAASHVYRRWGLIVGRPYRDCVRLQAFLQFCDWHCSIHLDKERERV